MNDLPSLEISEDDLALGLDQSKRDAFIRRKDRGRSASVGMGQTGTVRLRGNVWRLQYRGERCTNGRRRQHSIRLGDRREMSFEQARSAATLMLEQLAPRRVAPGSTCSWNAWCDRFIDIYLPNLRRGSQRTVASIIRRHLRPAFADLQIHELRVARIQSWVAAMRAKNAAPATIASRYRVFRRLLKRARAEGLAVEVPTPGDIDLPRSDKARPTVLGSAASKAYSPDELAQIFAAAGEPWLTLFMVCAFCGLRISEALGLRWCDVDLEAGRLLIVQQAARGREAALKTDSSAAERRIPPRLLEHLRIYRASCLADALYLFPSPRGGKPYDDSGVRRHHLTPLLKQLGIRGKSFHAFRHFFGTTAANAGVPVGTLQQVMRHADLRSTQQYITVTSDQIDRAIDQIESCYPPSSASVLSTDPNRNDPARENSH